MEKKLKRLVIIIAMSTVVLMLVGIFFGERISDFMSGFITGLSFTFIVGFVIYIWTKIHKK